MAKFRLILDMCQAHIFDKKIPVDYSDLRDMIDVETGSELPPSKLDTLTNQLISRIIKENKSLYKE